MAKRRVPIDVYMCWGSSGGSGDDDDVGGHVFSTDVRVERFVAESDLIPPRRRTIQLHQHGSRHTSTLSLSLRRQAPQWVARGVGPESVTRMMSAAASASGGHPDRDNDCGLESW